VGIRRLASGGLVVGGVAAGSAPFIAWFHVCPPLAPCDDVGLAGTAYGTSMTLFGLFAIGIGAALWRWARWSWWPVLAAVAMVFVVSAGVKGLLDPTGGAKASVPASSPAVVEADVEGGRGYRERVEAAFDRGELVARRRPGSVVAVVGGAVGLLAASPLAVRSIRRRA
jgi:hypothetical protein